MAMSDEPTEAAGGRLRGAHEAGSSVRSDSRLRIGFDNPLPPFAWLEGGRPEGLLIDRVAAIVAASGFAADYVALPLERSEEALLAGEVDLLAFKAIVPHRLDSLAFSRPIQSTGAALFALRGSPVAGCGDPAACGGRAIATPRMGPLANLLVQRCPDCRVVLTEGYGESLQAVIDGAADAAALNVHVGAHWAHDVFPGRFAPPLSQFAHLELAVAVARGRGDWILERLVM